MSQFQRSHDEIAQELEEKERLLQDKEVQAQVYKEEAESANARALMYEQEYYKEHDEKELAQIQHESLAKALMEQIEAQEQEDQLLEDLAPEIQEYWRLREELKQVHKLNNQFQLQLKEEIRRSDEWLQRLQQQSCPSEVEKAKKDLEAANKKNNKLVQEIAYLKDSNKVLQQEKQRADTQNREYVQEIAYLKESNQVLLREKQLAESQSETSHQQLFTTVLQNETGFNDPFLSQASSDLQQQLTSSRVKIHQLKRDKQESNEQLRRALIEVEKFRKEKEVSEDCYLSCQRDNEVLQYKIECLKRHNVSSHYTKSFQEEIDRLRKECQHSETDNKILQERIQELSLENKKLKIKAANFDDERKQYQEERGKWEQQNTIMLLEKAKLERVLQEVQGQHLSTASKEDPSKLKGHPKRVCWSDVYELQDAGNEDSGWSGDSAISGDVKILQQEHRYSSLPTPVYGMSASQSLRPLHRTQSNDEEVQRLRTELMKMKAEIQQLSAENQFFREKIGDCNSAYSQVQDSLPHTRDKEFQSKIEAIGYILEELMN